MDQVFDYHNYRDFLRDFYEKQKAESGYTYREFARTSGVNSTSWLLHLIRGTKNLSIRSIPKVQKAVGLQGDAAEYFLHLVNFTQAKTTGAKDKHYQKMLALKNRLHISHIERGQYEYYSKWYHPITRSLVSKVDFGENYATLARAYRPTITAQEAKASVELLLSLGLIACDESGRWAQTRPLLSTGNEVASVHVATYHKQILRVAENAHDHCPPEQRDISCLTLGISAESAQRIKTRIQDFRKEIMDVARGSENADRVYQFNFQFFPVSGAEA